MGLADLPTLSDQPRRAQPKAEMDTRVDVALAREAEDAKNERRWNAEIDARDQRTCRACGKRTDPEATGLLRGHRAHIVYASAGGSMEPFNRITLCPGCHNDEHKNRLRFSADGLGTFDANGPMEFWRKDKATGGFYLSRRETAPLVVEKD